MTEGAHYWRSPEGRIAVRPLEESRGHSGRSTVGGVWPLQLIDSVEAQTVGGVQKDTTQGQKLEES